MAKKEKKIPAKQQYYEQIISKQLYGAPPTREEGIAKLQADYDAWNQRQEGIAKLQADYDAWRKAQQPVEQPKAEMPRVEKAETPKAERQKAYAELHPESIPNSISYDEMFGKKKNVEVKAPEEKVYKTHADIIPSLTKANVEKQKKKEQSITKVAKQLGITEEKVKERMKEPTPKTAFKAPNESTLKSADKKVEKEALQKYLDPNKKLSKQEKREAKELLKQIKDEQGNKIKNTKGATPEQIEKAKDIFMTPEEEEISKLSEDLSTKLNPVYSMIEGIVSPYRRIAKAPDKALNKLESKIRYGEAQIFDALGVTQNAKEEALRKNAESLTELENEQERMDNLVSAATTQNPIPTTAGKLGGTLSQYYFTNGIFDAAAGALGATSAAGKFAANQLGQNAQDLVLDTLPQYKEFMSDGYLSPEEEKELKLNAAINVVGNAIPGLIGYAGESAKAAKATAESNEAFRKNALEGYEKLKALNAEDAAKQAEIPKVNRPLATSFEAEPINITKAEPTDFENLLKQNYDIGAEEAAKDVRLPDETFEQIDSYFEALAEPMNKVQRSGIMETVTDEKALKEWDNLNKAYSDYLNKAQFSDNLDDITAAKKNLDATRKRFSRAMKNIDPEIASDFNASSYGRNVGRPLNARNTITPNQEEVDEAFNLITELEESNNPGMYDNTRRVTQSIDNVPQNKVMAAEMEGSRAEIPQDSIEEAWELNERGMSSHIRGKGKMAMEGVSDEVVADFQDNPQLFASLKNSETKARAEDIYNTAEDVETTFRDMLRNYDPAALPLGHQIAKDYSAAGNHEAAAQIYREMGEQLTKSGQFSQAAVINMMKNDPLTALQYAQRQIDSLNQQGVKQFGDKWKNFSLTDAEKDLFKDIEPGDEEAIKAVFDEIGERIGKEYPTTFMDKLLEGRKIAMLFNVRTNVRNFGANVPTLGMRWVSDRLEAVGQNIAHLINPDFKVTQALGGSGKEGRKIATEVFNSPELKAMIEGTSGKYEIPELKNSIVKNKQMYKGNILDKWIDRVTDGGIQKLNEKLFGKKGVQSGLETIRNATYKMLDLGDSPFVKENFIERLGSYINAQGIKSASEVPEEAISTAWEEAMKATYKDESWAVKMLSGIKKGMEKIPVVGRAASQAAIPFLQAPGNIAARMVDYSPIRGSKGIADIISGARKADENLIRKGIEEASKGLTGTGLVLLGMKLRQSGILTGTYSKDKDQKAFEKQNGFKEFALHVKDKYFTYDWAQPFAQSLIVGTLLQDAIEKSDEYNSDLLAYIDDKAGTNLNDSVVSKAMGVAGEGVKAALNSWFNASPLQGLQELLSGGYTGTDIASNIKKVAVEDFAGAFVPATVNAVAKSIDPVQRNTYDPSNGTSSFINQQIAKLPGLSKTLPAKYDTWGREMKYAENKGMATAQRFVIPGEYSYDKTDNVDKEINRLFEATEGNAAVFPNVAPNKVGDKTLNNKEISTYQKDMGQRSRKLVEEFIKSDSYKSMSDADKVESLKKLYGVSKAITERDKFDKEPAKSSEYKKPMAEYDNAGGGEKGVEAIVKYYNAKSTADATGFASNSNASKAIQEDMANGNTQAAEKKVDAAQQIQSLGLEKPGPTYTYYNAEKVIPGLTPEKFVSTYKNIDTDGNQGIKQDELIDYLNSHNLSESEGQQIWNAYGNSTWKTIPSLNDGKWSKKKK